MAKATVDPVVKTGPELIKKLAASGTGEAKLASARAALRHAWEKENRVMTSEEVLEVMAKDESVPESTLRKAENIVDTGTHETPELKRTTIEDELMELVGGSEPAKTESDV